MLGLGGVLNLCGVFCCKSEEMCCCLWKTCTYFSLKMSQIPKDEKTDSSHELIVDRIVVDFPLLPKSQICCLLQDVFQENRTIPFIERYRKVKVSSIDPVEMRAIVDTYSEMAELNKSAQRFVKKYKNSLVGSEEKLLEHCVRKEDFDQLKAVIKEREDKKISKTTSDSISQLVDNILQGRVAADSVLNSVSPEVVKEFGNEKDLIQTVKASLICKILVCCEPHLEKVKLSLMTDPSIKMQVEEVTKKPNVKNDDDKKSAENFASYFNFTRSIPLLLAHQVMAINRGESQKFLKVHIVFPYKFHNAFQLFVEKTFIAFSKSSREGSLAKDYLTESYNRFEKKMSRFIRLILKANAIKESVVVLQKNLRQNLLVEPLKNVRIMGIDPGFKNGCKIAVIDETDCVIATDVLNLTSKNEMVSEKEKGKLKRLIDSHCIEVIALGDGCGSVEVDQLLSQMLTEMPQTSCLKFSTVPEAGVSIWSVSADAVAEFPNLEANLRSAVGLARRLRDPLSELSRVPPKHLSVGQYQHDIPENKLCTAMNDTMQEVVSFAGVDLNTVGAHVLNHVAGVGPKLAEKIVKCREALPGRRFMSREHLRAAVSGLGPKTFEQCAGFVKIYPMGTNMDSMDGNRTESDLATAPSAKKRKISKATGGSSLDCMKPNPLDVTIIHPSMYPIASEVIRCSGIANFSADDLVSGVVSERIKQSPNYEQDMTRLKARICGQDEDKMQDFDFVVKSLVTNLQSELIMRERLDFTDVTAAKKLKNGGSDNQGVNLCSTYTGRVCNVTGFGAFIDLVNVHDERGRIRGLAPISVNGATEIQSLQCGQRVDVKVINIDSLKRKYTFKLL